MVNKYKTVYKQEYVSQDILDKLILAYNSSVHSTTDFKPIDIHPGKSQQLFDIQNKFNKIAGKNIRYRAVSRIKAERENSVIIEKYDYVRVAKRVFSDFRKKTSLKTYGYKQQFTKQIYQVISISKKRDIANSQYILRPFDIFTKTHGPKIPRKFLRQDLQKIDIEKLISMPKLIAKQEPLPIPLASGDSMYVPPKNKNMAKNDENIDKNDENIDENVVLSHQKPSKPQKIYDDIVPEPISRHQKNVDKWYNESKTVQKNLEIANKRVPKPNKKYIN
jgi:hypothetical protein